MQKKNFNFESQNIFIGIDVHLKSWSVAIITENGFTEKYSLSSNKAEELFNHLCSKYPRGNYLSVYESGFCGFSAHYDLVSLGIKNIVTHAADVPSSQKEQLNKTDKVDALRLAKFLRNGLLPPIYVPSQRLLIDRELVRTRATIVKDISRWKSRIKHLLHRHGIEIPQNLSYRHDYWSQKFICWLEQEVRLNKSDEGKIMQEYLKTFRYLKTRLKELNTELLLLSKQERYKNDMELIQSVPGIGFHTGIVFLTEIVDVSRFANEKDFAGFLGIIPTCHSSGEREHIGEMTFRGNNRMRKLLIESSWRAVQCDAALSACFGQYTKRMKSNNAIIRIARKLSNRILHVLKSKTKYVKDKNDQSEK